MAAIEPTSTGRSAADNDVSGRVFGSVVQAGVISGGVRLQLPDLVDPNDNAVRDLQVRLREQWTQEVAMRGLGQPRPLRLRWRPATGAVGVRRPDSVDEHALHGALAYDTGDPTPAAQLLVEQFAADPRQQLVVLGAAGAGKSTLAVFYVLAAVDSTDTAPVLLSVAGWDPAESIVEWVVRRVAEDYPPWKPSMIRALLLDRKVVAVLDGLDELPAELLRDAMENLDQAAARGIKMVLTCRRDEFECAVGAAGTLCSAAVVEIQPIAPADAAAFLTQPETASENRWNVVLRQLEGQPDGPLARALSSPLMISLARRVYRRPADPAELIRFPTAEAVRQHLLDRYLPSAQLRHHHAPRWLAFLAHHLTYRLRDTNFEWWRLAAAVPAWGIAAVVIVMTTVASTVLNVLVGVAVVDGAGLGNTALSGALVGFSFGVIGGARTASVAHARPQHARPSAKRLVFRTLRDIAVLTCAVISTLALTLSVMSLVDQPRSVAITTDLIDTVTAVLTRDPEVLGGLLLVSVALVAVPTLMNAFGLHRRGTPHHNAPSWRRVVPSLAMGIGIGSSVTPVVMLLAWTNSIQATHAALLALLVATLIGIPIGVERWLGTPTEKERAAAPEVVLKQDRATLLYAVALSSTVCFGVTELMLWRLAGSEYGYWELYLGLIIAWSMAVLVFFGTGSSWLCYSVARIWCASCGKLPWRLLRFLQEARTTGLLRQVGPAYQLRHEILQMHLAQQRPAPRSSAARIRLRLTETHTQLPHPQAELTTGSAAHGC